MSMKRVREERINNSEIRSRFFDIQTLNNFVSTPLKKLETTRKKGAVVAVDRPLCLPLNKPLSDLLSTSCPSTWPKL
jgi:hypothetical protein